MVQQELKNYTNRILLNLHVLSVGQTQVRTEM